VRSYEEKMSSNKYENWGGCERFKSNIDSRSKNIVSQQKMNFKDSVAGFGNPSLEG
jgi:hypothetical protein